MNIAKKTLGGLLLSLLCPFVVYSQVIYDLFDKPNQEFQPWVYWMWVNGNVNKKGTLKDLESMHKVGINGAIILDVDQESPDGGVVYGDSAWMDIFNSVTCYADKKGMKIGANNGAGYWGSGGPWINPEMAMQWVVSSETYVDGGQKWKGILERPSEANDYKDIAVIAIPVIDTVAEMRYNIYDFPLKSCQNPGNAGPVRYSCAPMTYKALQWPGFPRYLMYRGTQSAPLDKEVPEQVLLDYDKILDISDKMKEGGYLDWNVPEGKWTIIRFGHQWTGSCIGPVTANVIGPESDKLSKKATRVHFENIVTKLKRNAAGSSFNVIHIDSWEGGGQNWTEGFDKIFQERRGYDIKRWLPVLTGRIINSLQETERFLFDLRYTVSELFIENYVQEMKRLANKEGLEFSYECYTTPSNDMNAMMYVDIPMAEFWIPIGWHPNFDPTVKLMSSAAHLNGTNIVAAEALTSSGAERWQWHPAKMKSLVDNAFCGGINRMVFHRYTSQSFDVYGPGVQMNIWGTKYERTNTWWDFSEPWHNYISRCQYLLQSGKFFADVAVLQSEDAGKRFSGCNITGYDYDVIGEKAFYELKNVGNQISYKKSLPYKLLVLPDSETMTVRMLSKVRDLVRKGAVVLGNRPKSVPGLYKYIEEERKLNKIADDLWGTGNDKIRKFGKGYVMSSMKIEEALQQIGIVEDFSSEHSLKYIHRKYEEGELYFVSNLNKKEFVSQCSFRTNIPNVEIWDPETGKRFAYAENKITDEGKISLKLPFTENKSWFVFFRKEKSVGLPVFHMDECVLNEYVIEGKWNISFPENLVNNNIFQLDSLYSWTEQSDSDVKFFSGTATYQKDIYIGNNFLQQENPLFLDLGKVEVMAKVYLNDKEVGVLWKKPYRLDITDFVAEGNNKLRIEVVNLWPNRLIGDENYPDDIGYDKNGNIEKWPEWLLEGKKRETGRKAFSARRQWDKNERLIESGLIGPVKILELGR